MSQAHDIVPVTNYNQEHESHISDEKDEKYGGDVSFPSCPMQAIIANCG